MPAVRKGSRFAEPKPNGEQNCAQEFCKETWFIANCGTRFCEEGGGGGFTEF
jgi:hypothetical protein